MTGSQPNAYVITGPTSGIGYQTALKVAAHGIVVLVGRNPQKLAEVQSTIAGAGGSAVAIVCDVADLQSVRTAAAQIAALPYSIVGVLQNAGAMPTEPLRNKAGWDLSFATNYLGPLALTEMLAPHLPDGANIVSVVSAIEDPDRAPAKVMGMKGGRFISVKASADGHWLEGGSRLPGIDAYATAKQCLLAAMLGLARENPKLRFNAVEPGINPDTGLGEVTNPFLIFLFSAVITRLPPFGRFRSTPDKAAKMIARVLTDSSGQTGVYFDEKGMPMRGSALAHDPAFQDKIISETREFLAAN